MPALSSAMLPLGTLAPDFELLDVISGKLVSLKSAELFSATVIIFMCNHCPYVKHILPKLVEISRIYTPKSVRFIGINANNIQQYPEDAPDKMRELAEKLDFNFPYVFDASQAVAKAYQAVCTPDFYVFDDKLSCIYRGRFDDATPGNQHPVTGKDLTAALDNFLHKKPVSPIQLPSIGCSIKWKTEN